MSRREDILLAVEVAYGAGPLSGLDGLTPEQLLDAYRTEVLAEAKVETVAWLVKKAREYRSTGSSQHVRQAEAVEFLASKVDRGAVRAFLGTTHYRDALDAHRAEVLAETYPGEVDMLRGLLATLHAVVQHGDLTDVRKLLEEHRTDHAQARAETSSHERRLAQLHAAIRVHRGTWTSKRVQEWRRFTGGPTQRGTASRDLAELHRRGHLRQHGPANGRFYTLKLRKDVRP